LGSGAGAGVMPGAGVDWPRPPGSELEPIEEPDGFTGAVAPAGGIDGLAPGEGAGDEGTGTVGSGLTLFVEGEGGIEPGAPGPAEVCA
jgi:hypothetical protein